AWHVQGDVVALAGVVLAGPGEVAPQRRLLAVLVGVEAGARERADAGADHRMLAALDGAVAAEQARHRADAGTDQGTGAGAVGIVGVAGLAGVGGAAGEHHGTRERGAQAGGLQLVHGLLLGVGNGPWVGPEYARQGNHGSVSGR